MQKTLKRYLMLTIFAVLNRLVPLAVGGAAAAALVNERLPETVKEGAEGGAM